MRPSLTLKRPIGTTLELPVSSFWLHRSMAWPVGQAQAILPPGVQTPTVGTELTIEAASDGGEGQTLFTGAVLSVEQGSWETKVVIEERTGILARTYMNHSCSGTAESAITELCLKAEAPCLVSGAGAFLSKKPLMANRSSLEHICRLARMSGYVVHTNSKGILRVGDPALEPGDIILTPSGPVLDYREEPEPLATASGSFAGDGALGTRGEGAEHWVVQSLASVTSGTGEPVRFMPGLKMSTDVDAAAQTAATLAQEAGKRRSVTVAGVVAADLGDIMTLQGFQNRTETARLYEIEVRWGAEAGLVTLLHVRATGG